MSDAEVDGADAAESGYRRDDYWREEAREGTGPNDVPEPPRGYAFESPEQKAKADGEDGGKAPDDDRSDDDTGSSGPGAEQGNAGGRDDARIVDD